MSKNVTDNETLFGDVADSVKVSTFQKKHLGIGIIQEYPRFFAVNDYPRFYTTVGKIYKKLVIQGNDWDDEAFLRVLKDILNGSYMPSEKMFTSKLGFMRKVQQCSMDGRAQRETKRW